MTGYVIRKFSGIAPRNNARLLADNQAQIATNCVVPSGTLRPLKQNLDVLTLPKAGTIRTIHRFGQDTANDAQYWFHWTQDVNVVRGAIYGDTQERTYWTGDGVPKVADNSNALAGANYPAASYTLGIPSPTTPIVATVGGTGDSNAIAETRLYVETFVSGWGEEGSTADASNEVTLQLGQTVALSLAPVPTGAYNLTARRIYRSVAGTTVSPYLFVTELPIATTNWTDTVLADDLKEEIPSLTFTPPPANLQGLVAMPGGVMAGFVGRDLYFCDPYKPHAWPVGYSMTVDSEIVALGVFDTTLLVLTKSAPFIVSGSDPANYTMVKADIPQACVSARSVVDVGGGVAFASPDGLMLVGGSGARNLTESHFTQREWQLMKPAEITGYLVDGRYLAFYSTGGFILDLNTGDLVSLDWTASAGFYDPIRDALFLVTGNNKLVKFDAGTTDRALSWRSKAFYQPRAINMGAARVEAAGYPVTFKACADSGFIPQAASLRVTNFAAIGGVLTEYLDADGKAKAAVYTQPVTSASPFRLPAGFLANQWEFEVSGAVEIYSAGFAESVMELQNG